MINGIGAGCVFPTINNLRAAGTPALSLDFLNPSLDSRITFTRASGGTRVNSAGLIETVPVNLVLQSNSFATTWVEVGTGVRGGSADVVGIDGTVSAWTLTDNDPASSEFIHQSATLTAANYTASVYIKKTSGAQASYPVIQLFDSVSLTSLCTVDTTNGIATVWTAYTGRTIQTSSAACSSFGDYWRVSLTFLATVASWRVGLFPAGSTSATQATGIIDVAAQGSAVVTATQLQTGSVATTYIPTTAAASGAPRFDYDPVTLAPRGLLIEEARTNLVATASWNFTNGVTNAGTTTDVFGTSTAQICQDTAANSSTFYDPNTACTVTAAAYNISLYLKRGNTDWVRIRWTDGTTSNGCQMWANLATGAVGSTPGAIGTGAYTAGSASVTPAGNGWYRCSISGQIGGALSGFPLLCSASADNSTTTVAGGQYITCAWQVELGSFPTSYIPTTTAAVTRAADVASMTGTNFSSWFNASEGTFVGSFDCPSNGTGYFTNLYGIGTTSDRITAYAYNGTIVVFEDRVASSVVANPTVTGIGTAAFKVASGYAANNINSAVNGTLGTLDTTCALPASMTDIGLGQSIAGAGVTGARRIQRITYFNKRLPDNTLKALSA